MTNADLHIDATYRIVPLDGGSFGVEVIAPGTTPAMMVPFVAKAAANIWIVDHKGRQALRRSRG
jgi:hypothetical protein